jgi:hypothetical protein
MKTNSPIGRDKVRNRPVDETHGMSIRTARHAFACALSLATLVPAFAAPASPPSGGCTVVAGGGRSPAFSDSQLNDRWNQLNFAFFDAAAEAVRDGGEVEQAFFPVGANDTARNSQVLLAQATKAGCLRVAQVAVFNDLSRAEPELVFSLRVLPIQRSGGDAPVVGAAEYEKEYRYPATVESFEQLVPSRIADRAVREYREQSQGGATLSVYRATGAVQCTGGGSTLEQDRQRLTDAGIQVLAATCGSNGRMFAQRCGGATGEIHVFDIPVSQKAAALTQQFRPLGELPGAQRFACGS